ncbi:MAG: hypothetical protein KA113_16075 [Syntrophaceae bacterium]|jgi:hypothetical protein|nr:hypothetical protein [Syntrophaceae bacterium]
MKLTLTNNWYMVNANEMNGKTEQEGRKNNLQDCPKAFWTQSSISFKEIEVLGPIRGNWQNFGPLTDDRYHCHLKKGRPTYVVVWEILSKKERLIEVTYVGTHEGAPYQKH